MRFSFSRGWLLATFAILIVGCSGPSDKKIDPASRDTRPPLEVPPDLTAPATGADLSAAVAGVTTYPDRAPAGQSAQIEVPPVLPLAKAELDAGRAVLTVLDDLGRAWRSVGLALDRAGFVVEDRDRTKGLYYVQYNDAQTNKTKRGVFSRWFGGKAQPAAERPSYQVRLERADEATAVRVLDANGAALSAEVTHRLLDALYQQLK
jgi:outer membrane protein assembly factor BamC